MAVERVVRIQRIWDVGVQAEYGDTDRDLIERAAPGTAAEAMETRTLMPMGLTCEDCAPPPEETYPAIPDSPPEAPAPTPSEPTTPTDPEA